MLWVLSEAILMSTHNICFYGEISKIIPKLSPNTLLICSSVFIKIYKLNMSHVMRKPVLAIWEQQRRRSACAFTQPDQHLCCSLLRWYNTYTCQIQNLKTVAGLCSWAGQFESYLVGNPEDRFSHDVAHIFTYSLVADYPTNWRARSTTTLTWRPTCCYRLTCPGCSCRLNYSRIQKKSSARYCTCWC